ncbi:unnamed protein product [Adineta ricciae]|uniref:Uncharacterized protein n=1 Tax=Adineta ricciae TaxID=249248 RepID=A0A814A002_ADIRI|nr:unnamed protein product [Adineta ricciae]CAF0969126.1 unnamed protein product [Adineta ricciae]
MIFLSKRPNRSQASSGKEACLSIIGLFLAIGLVGGLTALIYGLIKGNSSGVIGGGIALGVSIFLTVLFVLLIVFCLKTEHLSSHTRRHNPKGQMRHTPSSHEIPSISIEQKYGRTNGLYPQVIYPQIPLEFVDNSNYGFGRQMVHSPLPPPAFDSLNQSQSSANIYDLPPSYYN